MKSWLIPMAAGFGAGILSAWGVGGGTLLLAAAGSLRQLWRERRRK